MPLAAPVAAALTDHSAHPFALLVGGQDVTKQPGGNGFGTDPSTIVIVENGPGAVSAMDFEIEDPRSEVIVAEGMRVEHVDTATGTLNFAGFVDHWDTVVFAGGAGRKYKVNATGLETWLDWLIVPDAFTLNASFPLREVGQAFAAVAGRAGVLQTGAGASPNGNATNPVGTLTHPFTAGALEVRDPTALTITAGSTLRAAIAQLAAASQWQEATPTHWPPLGLHPIAYHATVDFYGRLRLFLDVEGQQPDDYVTLAIVDSTAGANVGAELVYTVDASTAVREAYIRGEGGPATAWLADGSGIRGRQVSYNDTVIGTGASLTAGYPYFRLDADALLESSVVRGSVRLLDWAPPATCHAGGLVSITDTSIGLAATFRIGSITKTFTPRGRQDWLIGFGGLPPAASRLLRSLIG